MRNWTGSIQSYQRWIANTLTSKPLPNVFDDSFKVHLIFFEIVAHFKISDWTANKLLNCLFVAVLFTYILLCLSVLFLLLYRINFISAKMFRRINQTFLLFAVFVVVNCFPDGGPADTCKLPYRIICCYHPNVLT